MNRTPRVVLLASSLIILGLLVVSFVLLFTIYYLRYKACSQKDTSTLDIQKVAHSCSTESTPCLCSDTALTKQPICFVHDPSQNTLTIRSGAISKELDLNDLSTDESKPRIFSVLNNQYAYFSYPFAENTVCIYNASVHTDQRFCYQYLDQVAFLTGPTIPSELKL